ncbi:MAG TPA: EamA family transporter [Longimicrobiaceae bacterium]|nr:EamA family transporter [Longimicrobiaceae bacterium]
MPSTETRRGRALTGYLLALCAGVLWGTTGPLSTALYAQGAVLTDVGFWRITLATLGFLVYGVARPGLFRIDRRGVLVVMVLGGALVAVFEVAYQYAIAGVGVAGAATLLYTAPVIVALLARPLLGERLTPIRLALAALVMVGVWLVVRGSPGDGALAAAMSSRGVGIAAGVLSAFSYAGSTLMARYAVPRYGSVRVLFFELAGGTLLLALFLPLSGHAPVPADTLAGWIYIGALGLGAVLAANFFFFAGVRRIDAAPAAVAASVEPVVGALLALLLFAQGLTVLGWIGLALVVGGVAGGYLREAASPDPA